MKTEKCKCGHDLSYIMGDEYFELYFCVHCNLWVIRNTEMIEEYIYLKEVDNV